MKRLHKAGRRSYVPNKLKRIKQESHPTEKAATGLFLQLLLVQNAVKKGSSSKKIV